jgi:uncharacterized membrane protein
MKKYFITGLVILLPVAVTIAVAVFMFNFLTVPFVGIMKSVLKHYDLLDRDFLFLRGDQLLQYASQLLVLCFLFALTISLGFITRWFFFHYFLQFGEYILHRIPVIRSIYKTSQDVIKTIFTTDTKSFKQVVMVPFPNTSTYSIGLITQENLQGFENGSQSDLVAVFVPTTPNPTSGFLMMFKQSDLIYLDMKIEEALKYVISCGVITTPFCIITQDEAYNKMHGSPAIADIKNSTTPKGNQ